MARNKKKKADKELPESSVSVDGEEFEGNEEEMELEVGGEVEEPEEVPVDCRSTGHISTAAVNVGQPTGEIVYTKIALPYKGKVTPLEEHEKLPTKHVTTSDISTSMKSKNDIPETLTPIDANAAQADREAKAKAAKEASAAE